MWQSINQLQSLICAGKYQQKEYNILLWQNLHKILQLINKVTELVLTERLQTSQVLFMQGRM